MNERLYQPPKLSQRRIAIATIGCVVIGVSWLIVFEAANHGQGRGWIHTAWRSAGVVAYGCAAWLTLRTLLRRAPNTSPERMPLIHAAIMVISMLNVFVTAIIAAPDTVRSVMFVWLTMPVFMVGIVLIQVSWARRVGDSRHCPTCEYEFNYPRDEDAPIRCPECGGGWLGLLRKGRRQKSKKMMWWGTCICIAGVVLMILTQPNFYLSRLSPHLPTWMLSSVLFVAPQSPHTAWNQLTTRTLSPAETKRLAGVVIRDRRTTSWSSPGTLWFETESVAGRIPSGLVEQYYRESVRADLSVPANVRAGEPFAASVRVKHCAQGFGHQVRVFFAGYRVGDAEPVGRRDETLWGYEMMSTGVLKRYRDIAKVTLHAPTQPGKVRVQAVYWLAHVPSFAGQPTWQADGTPTRPADAIWFEQVELERVIDVVP